MSPIKLVNAKDTCNEDLIVIRQRALIYNKAIRKYVVNSAGKIAVPTKDLKSLRGKFGSLKEYIESDKKWLKLRDFDDSQYPFDDWVDTLVKNWDKLILILNSKLPMTPKFDVIMSPKLERLFWQFYTDDGKKLRINKNKDPQKSSEKLTPTIDSDIESLLFYMEKYPEMSIRDILLTFRRDFSNIFIALLSKLREKGLDREGIIKVLKEKLNRKRR